MFIVCHGFPQQRVFWLAIPLKVYEQSKVYSPELLERLSAILPIHIDILVTIQVSRGNTQTS